MLSKLKNIFPNLVSHGEIPNNKYNEYQWFSTKDQEIIGVPKNEVTTKELDLLSTFLSPYNHFLPNVTEQERMWEKRIQSNTNEQIPHPFRFIYFSMQQEQIDPKTFKESINELFHKEVSILWKNNYKGIMIEEQTNESDEDISYDQIIDVLMSDLYVKLRFFVGPFHHNLDNIKSHYENLIKAASSAFKYTEKVVLSYIDAIPFFIIDQLNISLKEEIKQTVLKDFAKDREFLQTIEVFLESNLNISVAAKKLYMHRNSLQYRIDKFQEQTGIDIRNFHQALTVYLALIANR